MADPTSGVKSTAEIQRDMQQTREAITEKVAALENQVIGTIQTAADTVTHTVEVVKDAVSSTPAAVSDTVKQTVDAVKQTLHETVGGFSVGGCVRKNPWAALGTTVFAGFLFGRWLGRRESLSNVTMPRPAAAPPMRESHESPAEPKSGLLHDLEIMVGKELRALAEQSFTTLMQSVKQSLNERVPEVVDAAMHRLADRIEQPPRHNGRAYANGS